MKSAAGRDLQGRFRERALRWAAAALTGIEYDARMEHVVKDADTFCTDDVCGASNPGRPNPV